jgi:hypothetical protein
MGLLWRLFAPKGLKKARRALHPSWVLEDAIVRGVRKRRRRRRRQRRAPRRAPSPAYGAEIRDTDTGWTWRCSHDHPTQESASRRADAMEERINRLGWEQATGGGP